MHLRAQITSYELKGDLSPVMLNEIFHDKQMLPTFGGRCNRCF